MFIVASEKKVKDNQSILFLGNKKNSPFYPALVVEEQATQFDSVDAASIAARDLQAALSHSGVSFSDECYVMEVA